MTRRIVLLGWFILVGLATSAGDAFAQRTCAFAVPPSGASIDVPLNPAYVTSIDVWENLKDKVSGSLGAPDYEVRPMSARTLLIRPLRPNAPPGNMTLPTASGVKVVIAVTTVTDLTQACSLVTVTLVSEAEAFQRRVEAEVAKRTAGLEAEAAALRAEMSDRVRAGIDQELAARAVARRELVSTRAIDRSPEDLVVRVGEVLYLGDGAVVAFEIQNRRRSTISIDAVTLRGTGARELAAAVALEGGTVADGLGRVAGDGVTRGAVVVRSVATVRGQALTLTVRPVAGQGGAVTVKGLRLR